MTTANRFYILIVLFLPCLVNSYQHNKVKELYQKLNPTKESGLFSNSLIEPKSRNGLEQNEIVKNSQTKETSCLCLEEKCGKRLKNLLN